VTEGAFFETAGVAKAFGGLVAVADLSMRIEQGGITCLVGPNGAGKTTIFNLIAGVLRPDQGRIIFKGRDITAWSTHAVARVGIARSFQDLRLFKGMSVLENVLVAIPGQADDRIWRSIVGVSPDARRDLRARAMSILESAQLDRIADVQVSSLSYAEQKLLTVARLIATGAELLLLDEPLSGLDEGSIDRVLIWIKMLVRSHGKTALLIEHNYDMVRAIADQVVFLDQGRVLYVGTADSVSEQSQLAEIYFGS
jgi:branched-chain amino acid transport system permease protein